MGKTYISGLFDLKLLNEMIAKGFITRRAHPSEPLDIYNYTAAVQYDRVWNDATLQCRGLIVHRETGEVIARPWKKFFNYGEHDIELKMDTPVRVFDKIDGSLGICYPTSDDPGWAIATRGSFESEQALRGTEMLRRAWLHRWVPHQEFTYLFEIIYPENRIVVDYKARSEIVLLDVLETHTGESVVDYNWAPIPEPWVDELDVNTLGEALKLTPRSNAEGIVLRFADGLMLKMKQEDYIALHKIVTGLNEKTVWEALKEHRFMELLDKVPDEFTQWVKEVAQGLSKDFGKVHLAANTAYIEATGAAFENLPADADDRTRRKLFAAEAVKSELASMLFMLYDRKSIHNAVWDRLRPVRPQPMKVLSEDTA